MKPEIRNGKLLRLSIVLLAPLVLPRCAPKTEFSGVFEADSSGVRILTVSDFPTLDLRVGRRTLRLGGPEASDEAFSHIRGVEWFGDGSFAVLNSGWDEVGWYDPSGRLRAKMGREGEGPGEFIEPIALWRESEVLLAVMDSHSGRISIFNRGGELARTVEVPLFPRGIIARGVGTADDSTVVLVHSGVSLAGALSGGGSQQDSTEFFKVTPSNGDYRFLISTPGVRMQVEGSRVQITHPTLSVAYATGKSSLLIAPGDERQIQVFDLDGRLRASLRLGGGTPDRGGGIPEERVRRKLAIDDMGRIWASGFLWGSGQHQIPDEASEKTLWLVFEPDLIEFSGVVLPSGFTPYDFEGDQVIGVMIDDLGVESVEVYEVDPEGV